MDRRQFLRAASYAGFASFVVRTKASSLEDRVEAQNGIIWRANSKKGQVYLTPTIHKLPRHLKVPPRISNALQHSDAIFLEANTDDKAHSEDKSSLMYVDESDSVFKHLSPETAQLLQTKLSTSGIPIEKIKSFKPWVISSILEERELESSGLENLTSAEELFKGIATAAGKKIAYLETISQQFRIFDSLPDSIQDAMLKNYLRQNMSPDDTRKVVSKIAIAWENGNVKDLQTEMKKIDVVPAAAELTVNELMLWNRNISFFKQVDACLDLSPNSVATLAVGFNHYLGEHGLLKLFENNGYKLSNMRTSI